MGKEIEKNERMRVGAPESYVWILDEACVHIESIKMEFIIIENSNAKACICLLQFWRLWMARCDSKHREWLCVRGACACVCLFIYISSI